MASDVVGTSDVTNDVTNDAVVSTSSSRRTHHHGVTSYVIIVNDVIGTNDVANDVVVRTSSSRRSDNHGVTSDVSWRYSTAAVYLHSDPQRVAGTAEIKSCTLQES